MKPVLPSALQLVGLVLVAVFIYSVSRVLLVGISSLMVGIALERS